MYFSPFHIVFYGQKKSDLNQSFSYKKVKQRVLAKYDLIDNQPLEIKGRIINKGEAIELIQELKDEQNLEFHKQVFKDQELLDFLEEQNDLFLRRKDVYFQEEFKTWISECFAESFALILQSELKGKYPSETFMGKDLGRYVKSYHFDLVFRKAVSQVRVLSAEFMDILSRSDEKGFKRECSLKADTLSKKYAQRLNKAQNHLEDAREELSSVLLQTAILLNDQKTAYHLANRFTSFCLLLNTSNYQKDEVKRVHKVVVSNSRGGGSVIPNTGSNFWNIGIFRGLLVLLVVGGFFVRNCRDKTEKYEFPKGITSHSVNQKKSLKAEKEKLVTYFNKYVSSINTKEDYNITTKYESLELESGDVISAKNWIPLAKKNKTTKISNLTQFDCVLFLKRPYFGFMICEKSIYIKAGEFIELGSYIKKEEVMLAYLGTNFTSSHCAYCDIPETKIKNSNIRAGFSKKAVKGAFINNASFIKDFSELITGDNNHIEINPVNLISLDKSN